MAGLCLRLFPGRFWFSLSRFESWPGSLSTNPGKQTTCRGFLFVDAVAGRPAVGLSHPNTSSMISVACSCIDGSRWTENGRLETKNQGSGRKIFMNFGPGAWFFDRRQGISVRNWAVFANSPVSGCTSYRGSCQRRPPERSGCSDVPGSQGSIRGKIGLVARP